ncbi:oxidoreductase domain-containing protein [Salinarchaeum sp. Harcht-Bsk1]|uniref:Gfo/Idh/MocA family protein n=1 Tax=Salinarchaeum sp. Harcht-Bsk1 TaxID=1333523 RepID=UPI000342316A|nr:Gfo/Idh/MocA family oxidoreductase [Salinarchaeum sp. Harcht-Bsk1]AGN01828.1 oxidoreductase domain-containing protein [Salinarchaeum sp. Harcht-Bsk1]
MTTHRVAFVGTGADPENPSSEGFAMAYQHASAYERLGNCELVGCADIVRENAEAFADRHDIDEDGVFEDYEEMVEAVDPDVVSVCTPPATHADIVVGLAESGVPDAIHCEKPMAMTWGGAKRMAAAAERADVALTFNHMRRFGDPFRDAKALLDDGAIGDLRRIEYSWGNFYDNGTHAIDMCNYFNDEYAPSWVIGQLDYREEEVYFGTHNENQMLASWEYENGVYGMATTGPASEIADGDWRLVGTEGVMDVHLTDEVAVRVRSLADDETESFEYDGLAGEGESCIDRAIADVVQSVETGEESELSARNALNATEIIFAGYESVRRRGRVDLPLDIEDNPLEEMVASGELSPRSSAD